MNFRTSIRDLLWTAMGSSGISSLASRLVQSPATLRILIYHDIPAPLLPTFEAHLNWLRQHFDFLRPNDLLLDPKIGGKPKLLLTFDDGCVDNYELVAPLLESCGLRGLFFVCPGLAGLTREACFRLMERSSMLLGEKTRDGRWQRMSQEQIIDLDHRGHRVGSHTMTHTPLTKVEPPEMLREIRESGATLESWLGHPCPFFAWTYSWNGITPESLAAASSYHRYCFSPCSGLNPWRPPGRLFWRTAIDVSKPVSHLQTQVSGLSDYFYRTQRSQLSRMWDAVVQTTNPCC